ncbi:hypothetical protein [Helicobacter bizzozeronii]|uniref:hypothetical protein n=1 Tax=Helicobacter bizzozeronii TaxID=56877 RepID=UPI00024E5C0E|nr:hypothetical protein [Helicobacter bizzozeronii]CCF81656.1 hypothetical protein HBZS_121070 [Helicobacter bizzozeronii CCUG 35545]
MKLAKFALTCDGEKITSLDQLKEHFNLLDVLEHYKTNTLWRWLRSRDYENELRGVEAITATQDTEILSALCGVFGVEADLQAIQEMPENQKHMEEKAALRAEIETLKAQIQALQSATEEKSESYDTLKKKLLKAKGLVTGRIALKELLKNHADLLERDKIELADHLGFLTINKRCDRDAFRALLFYFLASPIFKADEIEEAWVNKLRFLVESYSRSGAHRSATSNLCFYLYQKNEVKERALDFDTLKTKPHDFGKLVCLYYEYGRYGKFLDANNQQIKQIGEIFITHTLKVSGDDYYFNGRQILQYLELDI